MRSSSASCVNAREPPLSENAFHRISNFALPVGPKKRARTLCPFPIDDAPTLRRSHIMKRTQLVVLSVLALGLAGAVQASPFPADAEASYNKLALDSYAEQHARAG